MLAALLSTGIPGLGQLYAGKRRRGWWLIGISVALGLPAVVLVLLLFGPWELDRIGLAVDLIRPFFQHPGLLVILFVGTIVLLAFRVFAVLDAFLAARTGSRPGWQRTAAAALALGTLLTLVAWPHGWTGVRTLALHDALTHDYSADPAQVATPTTLTTTTTTAAPAAAAAAPGDPSETAAAPSTTVPPTTTTTTTTQPPDPFAGQERITIALLGGDSGPGRSGIRTDTIIVVTVEIATGQTAMFQVPRNQTRWPVPEGIPAYESFRTYPRLTNTIYGYGLERPELFPGGPNTGGNALKAIIGEGLGLEIDYFALVDLLGFIDLVDALGGIDISVTKPVYDPGHHHPDGTITDVNVPVGDHHFDGKTALAYSRARRQDDDYHRMDRQRCVLEAVASEADPFRLLRLLPVIAPIIQNDLITDIPVARFPDLIELAEKVDTDRIVTIRFLPYAPELQGTGTSYYTGGGPNVEFIRQTVQTVLDNPPEEVMTDLNLTSLEEVCEAG